MNLSYIILENKGRKYNGSHLIFEKRLSDLTVSDCLFSRKVQYRSWSSLLVLIPALVILSNQACNFKSVAEFTLFLSFTETNCKNETCNL